MSTVSDYIKEHDYNHQSAKGLRVKIKKCTKNSYTGKFSGCTGTIVSGSRGVKLDGYKNPNSKYNCFWFKEYELEIMEDDKVALSGNYRVAVSEIIAMNKYDSLNKKYNFALYPSEDDVIEGDYFLASIDGNYAIAKVESIKNKEEISNLPTAEVICKLDFSNFDARKKARAEKNKLRKKMDAMVQTNQEMLVYQALAKESPEMAKLLEDYKALGDV